MNTTEIFYIVGKQLSWMPERTLFLTYAGSRSYGTHTPTSDFDLRGVCLPPKEYFFGFAKNFEQLELKAPNPDLVIYALQKFFSLAISANPNILETLFTDPSDHLFVSPAAKKFLDVKDKFLSKRIRFSFGGYAKSQIYKMKTHRGFLLNPPKEPPTREGFGLPKKSPIPGDQLAAAKAQVKKELEKYNFDFLEDFREDQKIAIKNSFYDILSDLKITSDDKWFSAVKKLGYEDNLIHIMQLERQYDNKKKEWDQYKSWERDRSEKRFEMEKKFGFCTKNAYHLIRLIRMANEILSTGQVFVKRPDAEELLAIRNGAWSYEQILEYAETEDAKLDVICAKSKIADKPDVKYLDKLCVELMEEYL